MEQNEEVVGRLQKRCAELEEEVESAKWRSVERREARNGWKRWMEGREWNGEVPWSDLNKEKQRSESVNGRLNESLNELSNGRLNESLNEISNGRLNESLNESLNELSNGRMNESSNESLNESKESKESSNTQHFSNESLNESHLTNSPDSPTPLLSSTPSSLSNSQSTLQTHSDSAEKKDDPAFDSVEWSESMRTASSLQFMNQLLIQQLAEERKRSSEAVSSEVWKQTKEEAESLRCALEKAKKENEELRDLLSKTDLTDYQLLEDSQEGSEM